MNRLNQPTYLSYRDGGSWTSERGASKLAYKFLQTKSAGYGYDDEGCIINGFKVEATGTSLSVRIGADKADEDSHLFIKYGEYGYIGFMTNEINLSLAGSDQIFPRKSFIVAYVDLSKSYTGSTPVEGNTEAPDSLLIVEVEGSAEEGAPIPTESQIKAKIGINNPYIILAEISVPANASAIANSQIIDNRFMAALNPDINLSPDGSYTAGFYEVKSGAKTRIVITGPNDPTPAGIPGVNLIWLRKKL